MAQRKNRRRKQMLNDRLVLKLSIIVFAVIFIFEGQLIVTMVTFDSSKATVLDENDADSELVSAEKSAENDIDAGAGEDVIIRDNMFLAGLGNAGSSSLKNTVESESQEEESQEEESEEEESLEEESPLKATVSDPESTAIVREQPVPVDDSYFNDAVFIGDSRMEGFRNTSGISSGTFFTSVGMSLSSMTSEAIISEGNSKITVAAALSGRSYGKIYLMFGANDLGTYDWDAYRKKFVSLAERFSQIQPNAVFYVCSCIYVNENLVTTGDYINNQNVDKLNQILLEVCEEEGYYYLDLNEAVSDGYGSLPADASVDGVHLNADYCGIMLEYMKSHYVSETEEENIYTAEETEEETEGEFIQR